jgi:hypothetical protein
MGQEFHVKNVYKVLAGLHSHTFNFLAKHHESLAIDKEQDMKSIKVQSVRSIDFYSNCVSLNRPCKVPGMAKSWPAFKRWNYANGGTAYLTKLFND